LPEIGLKIGCNRQHPRLTGGVFDLTISPSGGSWDKLQTELPFFPIETVGLCSNRPTTKRREFSAVPMRIGFMLSINVRNFRLCGWCRQTLIAAWLGCGAVGLLLSMGVSASAGEPIAVAVASGRIFAGEVDSRTDEAQLWLRSVQPGCTLARPIAWQSIVLAERGDRQLSSAELQAQIDDLKTVDDVPQVLPPPPNPWAEDARLAQYIQTARENNTQVNSISIDAHVAQWSRTVQANGIVLHLYALDAMGRMMAADGTLDVELIAQVPPGSPRGESLPRIGRWTVRVTPDQFGPAGAVIKLPYQGVQPEFDLNVGPYGLVHATFSVPGAGTFETSQAMMRIRPYSAVRDEEQQLTGRRFFDIERVDRWAP
jgi:hypothetical protein